jgi:hypothetical protein
LRSQYDADITSKNLADATSIKKDIENINKTLPSNAQIKFSNSDNLKLYKMTFADKYSSNQNLTQNNSSGSTSTGSGSTSIGSGQAPSPTDTSTSVVKDLVHGSGHWLNNTTKNVIAGNITNDIIGGHKRPVTPSVNIPKHVDVSSLTKITTPVGGLSLPGGSSVQSPITGGLTTAPPQKVDVSTLIPLSGNVSGFTPQTTASNVPAQHVDVASLRPINASQLPPGIK